MITIHTLTINKKIDSDDYFKIAKNLKENNQWKQIPNGMVSWCLCEEGITKIKLEKVFKKSIKFYKIEFSISARRVLEPGNFVDLMNVNDFQLMADIANQKLKKISEHFPKIETCSIKRLDFCHNIKFNSASIATSYIQTLRRCNLPKGLERTGMYDPIAKRWKPFPNAFTFGNDGYVEVALYDKKTEMLNEKDGAYPQKEIDRSTGIIRLEIRCKKGKIKALKKKFKFKNAQEFFQQAEVIGNEVFSYYLRGIAGKGKVYTLKKLKKEIEKSNIKSEKKSLMIELAENINLTRNASLAIKEFAERYGKTRTKKIQELFDLHDLNYITITEKSEKIICNFVLPHELMRGGDTYC